MQKVLPLTAIRLDSTFQVRLRLDEELIQEYARAARDKAVFPPMDVFQVDGDYVVADGWHRYHGFRLAGKKIALCEVHPGDRADCLRFALRANDDHGLRRSREDRQHAVSIALGAWPELSNREIAKLCAVSHTMVNEIRPGGLTEAKVEAEPGEEREPMDEREPRDEPVKVEFETDRMGFKLPPQLAPTIEREQAVSAMLDAIAKVRSSLKAISKEQDPLFFEVNFSAAIADLSKAHANISTAKSYAVCPTCQGQLLDTCVMCKGKGLISKFRWEVTVPLEVKKLREKMIQMQNDKNKGKAERKPQTEVSVLRQHTS